MMLKWNVCGTLSKLMIWENFILTCASFVICLVNEIRMLASEFYLFGRENLVIVNKKQKKNSNQSTLSFFIITVWFAFGKQKQNWQFGISGSIAKTEAKTHNCSSKKYRFQLLFQVICQITIFSIISVNSIVRLSYLLYWNIYP